MIGTEKLALVMTPLTLSEEVLASNLDRDTGNLEGFRGFPRFLQEDGV